MDKIEVRSIFAAVSDKSTLDPLLDTLEQGKRPGLGLADSRKRPGLDTGAVRFWGTEGTVTYLKSKGFDATSVVSGFDFDGRVKSLDRAIFARILADRTKEEHLEELKKLLSSRHSRPDRESDPRTREDYKGENGQPFDAVIVDLYPLTESNFPESMDIGGQALIRAAIKNYKNVALAFDQQSIKDLAHELRSDDQSTTLTFRKTQAGKALKFIAQRAILEANSFN